MIVSQKNHMWVQAHKWSCHICDSNCDLDSIEAALLHVVQQRAKLFQLQDLVCVKCKNVSLVMSVCGAEQQAVFGQNDRRRCPACLVRAGMASWSLVPGQEMQAT